MEGDARSSLHLALLRNATTKTANLDLRNFLRTFTLGPAPAQQQLDSMHMISK